MSMKEDDFADWYLDIVEKANLSDKRYPIKGMNVWTPYGWKIMRQIDTYIRQEFDATRTSSPRRRTTSRASTPRSTGSPTPGSTSSTSGLSSGPPPRPRCTPCSRCGSGPTRTCP